MRTLALYLALSCIFSLANTPAPVPNFPLVNQEGKPFQLYDLKGNFLFISFIYSRCPLPKMCPLTMSLSKELLTKTKKDLAEAPIHFLFVTLDPNNDTPAALKEFSKKHRLSDKKNVTFATGAEQTLSDFASEFNIMGTPSAGMISHNMKSILVGPGLAVIKEYKDNEWKPEDVVKDIQNALSKKS